jgi:surface antigen
LDQHFEAGGVRQYGCQFGRELDHDKAQVYLVCPADKKVHSGMVFSGILFLLRVFGNTQKISTKKIYFFRRRAMKKMLILLILIAFVLPGCSSTTGPKEGMGTVLGAGTGALIGSQIGGGRGTLVAVAVGTLAGAILGQEVGRSLDRADTMAMRQNAQYGLEHTKVNQTTTWVNPDTGNSGAITPVKTYQTAQGQYCREYTQTVTVAGQQQQAYGTACRQPDGTWLIIK